MGVSYDKLRVLMARYRITGEMLRKETGITTTEAAKINKDIYLQLQSVEKITKYFTKVVKRKIRVEEILTFTDD